MSFPLRAAFHRTTSGLVLAAAAVFPQYAPAQGLSANELWLSWQAQVGAAGGALTATETREGNRIALRDLLLDAGEAGRLRLPELTLVSQADGSVGIVLPERFPLELTLPGGAATADDLTTAPDQPETPPPPAEPPVTLHLTVAAPGLALSILGLGDNADFQATAPTVSVILDRIDPPPASINAETSASFALADLELHYKQELGGTLPKLDSALTLGTLHGEIQHKGDTGDSFTAILDGAAIDAGLSWALPPEALPLFQQIDNADPATHPGAGALLALLEKGLFLKADVKLGATLLTIDGTEENGGPVSAKLALGGADLMTMLDQTAIAGSAALRNLDMAVDGQDETLASVGAIGIEEYRFGISLGLNGLRGPQPWTAAYVLRNLYMSENFWAETDPKGVIPHDPLTFAIDLKGDYAIQPEALAPGWQPPEDGTPPLAGFSIRSNELTARGLGLDASGSTDLRLDFSDMVTYEGAPLPQGRISLAVNGLYALIDRLVEMGQISADDATGARLGLLGMAKAGSAPDSLTTDLEFRDKSFYLNGQKIR